jgi:hypothetical protein
VLGDATGRKSNQHVTMNGGEVMIGNGAKYESRENKVEAPALSFIDTVGSEDDATTMRA